MKKGIVLEVNDEFITMLTPEGEFLKTKLEQPVRIGEEANFFPIKVLGKEETGKALKRPQILQKKFAWFSSLAALIVFFAFIPFSFTTKAAAFMSIDINPSLEIGMDEELSVISLKALNEEGEQLLDNLDGWKKKKVSSVTEDIIKESQNLGYLKNGQNILLATVIESEKKGIQSKLDKQLKKVEADYDGTYDVTKVAANEETRKRAKKKGISTGKLLRLEKKTGVLREPKQTINPSAQNSTAVNPPQQERKVPAQPQANGGNGGKKGPSTQKGDMKTPAVKKTANHGQSKKSVNKNEGQKRSESKTAPGRISKQIKAHQQKKVNTRPHGNQNSRTPKGPKNGEKQTNKDNVEHAKAQNGQNNHKDKKQQTKNEKKRQTPAKSAKPKGNDKKEQKKKNQ